MKISVKCPECKNTWEKQLAERSADDPVVSTSNVCPDCQLKLAFRENPGETIEMVRGIQAGEHNFLCFCTGEAAKCDRNCRWRVICDQWEMVQKRGRRLESL